MRTNTKTIQPAIQTHEGGRAVRDSNLAMLKRTVLACMLFEKTFYEDGLSVADRIKTLVPLCEPNAVSALAIEARTKHNLRHVSLLIARELARDAERCPEGLVAFTVKNVIQRADELSEFLAMYWNGDNTRPISGQVKKGLAWAFNKFDEYQLAKYNRDNGIKLRDVLFLVRAKPKDTNQADLWKRLANKQLKAPDTWEVALAAAGEDKTLNQKAAKAAVFTRLIKEENLGYLALLRNLRNMEACGVSDDVVIEALLKRKGANRVLPFRFLAAATAAPRYEPTLDMAMLASMEGRPKLFGKTVVLLDVSHSMDQALSSHKDRKGQTVPSDLKRVDAACGLAILLREVCEDVAVYTFSKNVVEVPARHGMALRDAIVRSQQHASTYMGMAVSTVSKLRPNFDRLIVLTDEQSQDNVITPKAFDKRYMINVATDKHGVAINAWHHINGFSEAVVDYILAYEDMGKG